jgi:type I restriction enzyme S subunit
MKKGWQTKTLGETCEVVNGGTPKTGVPEYWDGQHRWITPAEMGKRLSPYVSETERMISDLGLRNSSAQMLPPHSVILSSRAPIGHLVINTELMATNQGCKGLIPRSQLQHKFLYYYLSSIVDLLNSLGTGATFKELSGGKLKEVEIPAPPLAEQQRIVGLLDEAFEGLATAKANAEKNLQNARALFESHLQSVFTQRGPGWVEKTLGDICVVDWGNTDLTKSSYVEGGKFLAVSAAGCDGRIGHKEHAKHTPVLSAIGAQCGRMFLPEEDFTAIKNTITLTPRDDTCAGKFLYRLLTHVELPKRGAAQPFIAKGDILKFQIVVPEDSEAQLRIVDSLAALEEETQSLARLYERKHAALEALKKSLLHQAFAGEL